MDTWYDELIQSTSLAVGFLHEAEVEDSLLLELATERVPKHGSRPGRRANIERNFQSGHDSLYQMYFSQNSTFDEKTFARRFRMSKKMFLKIMENLNEKFDYFKLRRDAVGKIGLSPLQKCSAALRVLAYGSAADSLDEVVRIGESTVLETMRKFCDGIIDIYEETYLRLPNAKDVDELRTENAERGFPGMIASIDCMHWVWKNCPVALKGQYQGKERKATVVLEACASQDGRIWHCFFGTPGSCNDLNILDRSPLLNNVLQHNFLGGAWTMQGRSYDRGYLLADGIYPDWTIFVKTISQPQTAKEKLFAKEQESLRKDVERSFGILQACWQILVKPCKLWDQHSMMQVIKTCIILHNMRIEYKKELSHMTSDNFEPLLTTDDLQAGFTRYSPYQGRVMESSPQTKRLHL
ncbi:uncharacterized protein LOC131695787 [Topomyia yanbarensis]|uniref:uncharacterized protein LOC131695787 n=1 Tax=Topomyia yanbarensis TaxID=2498891 RepID=UPI00273BA66D|nr:uncharacterized protein LOC131695787 [Topomyia yanbarensis]